MKYFNNINNLFFIPFISIFLFSSSYAGPYTCANPKNFDIAYQINAPGNLKLIGNTNICEKDSNGNCIDPGNTKNNSIAAEYKDGDTNINTKNSSAAKLELPDGAEILWAGLYWQGYFDESKMGTTPLDDAIKDRSKTMKLGYTADGTAPPSRNVSYTTITADKLNWVYFKKERWYYQGFSEVTNFVKNKGKGWYWGADINLQVGTTVAGGSLGAWSIAIAYRDESDTVKNLTVYHGYLAFAGNTDVNNAVTYANNNGCDSSFTGVQKKTQVTLSGFRTPSAGDINSRFIVFAGEGDIGLTGDGISMSDKSGTSYPISNPKNPANNVLNSSITDYGVHRDASLLYPRYGYNTIGIDIDTFDTGGDGSNGNFLNHEQNTTKIELYTSGDGYFPGGFGLATQLYVPSLCYDYSVRVGDHIKLSSENRDVNTSRWGDDPLVVKAFIRSLEADFDLIQTRLKTEFTPSGKFAFINNYATVSPPNINAYLSAIETNTSQVSIGKNNSLLGGEIGANESTYAKIGFDFLASGYINSHFEFEIDTAIAFDPLDPSNTTPFHYSTQNDENSSGYIGLCPRNPVYDPIYGRFNIERQDSTFAQTKAIRYPLYTQITGKDFNVSIASYGGTDFDQPLDVNNTTVELELIDAGGFDNNSSNNFDSVCEEPEAIGGDGAFVYLDGTSRKQVDLKTDMPGFKNDLALQDAAFRAWFLTKQDANSTARILVQHHCADKNDQSCFAAVYNDNYKNADDLVTQYCATACQTSSSGCYDCLKKYFSTPVCSRDNFSIRPESYRITVSDNNESNNTSSVFLTANSTTQVDKDLTLAAGYHYHLDINATRFNNSKYARGYYNNQFYAEGNITTLDSKNKVMAPLTFIDTRSGCSDKTHRTLGLRLQNGQLVDNASFTHQNAGRYAFQMYDGNWTNVDQASYPFKVTFDPNCKNNSTDASCNDCLVNTSTSNETDYKVGCTIASNTIDNSNYIDLLLSFLPYAFDLNEVNLTVLPDNNASYIFMNDFGNSYYKDQLLNPLSQSMSSSYIGNLSAVSKSGTVTSNFTNGCAAEDVILHIDKTTSPTENAIHDSDGHLVPFQQFLQHTSTTSNIASSASAIDANTTLPKVAFSDTINPGSAYMLLHTNFKKPVNTTVNPIDVNYTGLYAYSPNAQSSAQMVNDYVPDGNKSSNRNVLYYFAKVTPFKTLYDNVKTSSIDTPLFVDIYCDLVSPLSCSDFNLNQLSKGEDQEAGWYSANMFDKDHDGTTDLSVKTIFGDDANPSVSPNNDVQFDDNNGTQNDINVSLAGPARPSTVEVEVRPVPWLLFDPNDPNGYPHYRIKFIGDSAWSGVGNVGNAVEATSNENPGLPRLSW